MTNEEIIKRVLESINDGEPNDWNKIIRIRKLVNYNHSIEFPKADPKYTIKDIQEQIVIHTGLTLEQINSNTREFEIVIARQLAQTKARMFTNESLSSIAYYFGRKDGATVLNSQRKINGYMKVDKSFRKLHGDFLES